MGCSGCGKARAAMAAQIQAQAKLREQRLAQLPPDQRFVIPATPPVNTSPVPPAPVKTPRQLRIEARAIRIARRNARKAAEEAKKNSIG